MGELSPGPSSYNINFKNILNNRYHNIKMKHGFKHNYSNIIPGVGTYNIIGKFN